MNNHIKKIISVLSCTVLSALFVTVLYFAAPAIATVPEATDEIEYKRTTILPDGEREFENVRLKSGEDFTAVNIGDLGELCEITKVNYVKDVFIKPGVFDKDITIVDLTKPFDFAEKGSLMFVVMNLDPYREDFFEKSEALSEFKIGEYWHFTLSIPHIFCASNIYTGANLSARNGEIEGYDFIEYNTTYDKKTETFVAETTQTNIDLQFYGRRQAMNRYQTVTIHYQSSGTSYSGMDEKPIIGTDYAVKKTVDNSRTLLIVFVIIAAVVCAVLIVLSLLKRTEKFISAVVWILGIMFMLLSRFILWSVTAVPLLLTAISLCAPFFVLGGALLCMGKNFGKVPTKYIFPALAALGACLAFSVPFVPFGVAVGLRTASTVLKAINAVALTAFLVFAVANGNDKHGTLQTTCAALIDVAVAASLFMSETFPVYFDPLFWLCAAIIVITFVSVFIVFNETEKANSYLTANLHLEIERQVNDIKAVITERDNLLRFVSHDMKKPLQSSVSLLDTAIEREKDSEQIKTLKIIKQNDSRVVTNLSEIGEYARFNYIAEPSQVVDLRELCARLYEFHKPDCNANGIILRNLVDKRLKIFVKKQGLENAVSNIIMNAVEHASCHTVTVYAKTDKNRVVLCIADDGKGISSGMDIFKPYVTEKTETGGVGLFICKNIIESMNGTLTFESKQGNTVFCISLLKA